jgi:hypothetical protein
MILGGTLELEVSQYWEALCIVTIAFSCPIYGPIYHYLRLYSCYYLRECISRDDRARVRNAWLDFSHTFIHALKKAYLANFNARDTNFS